MSGADREDRNRTDIEAVLLAMNQRQQQHGEILIAILTMLRGEDDKNKSNDLISELLGRLDRQTAMIRALLVAVAALGKDVPATVLRLLRETEDMADHPSPDDGGDPHRANGRRAS